MEPIPCHPYWLYVYIYKNKHKMDLSLNVQYIRLERFIEIIKRIRPPELQLFMDKNVYYGGCWDGQYITMLIQNGEGNNIIRWNMKEDLFV
jgi:hypothetical protein